MSLKAKATLGGAVLLSSFIIWGVHYQQNKERSDMYEGVLKDDERRRLKMQQRKDDLDESTRKRRLYEGVQPVDETSLE